MKVNHKNKIIVTIQSQVTIEIKTADLGNLQFYSFTVANSLSSI